MNSDNETCELWAIGNVPMQATEHKMSIFSNVFDKKESQDYNMQYTWTLFLSQESF